MAVERSIHSILQPIIRPTSSIAIVLVPAVSSLLLFISYFLSLKWLVLAIGMLCSLMLGVLMHFVSVIRSRPHCNSESIELMLDLAKDKEIASLHRQISQSLVKASQRNDTIFRHLLKQNLRLISEEAVSLGHGRVQFTGTESWRLFYEQLLRSPGINHYRSVAHIQAHEYWQDGAGRHSTQLNLELHDAGSLQIERIAIVADHLWHKNELFPVANVHEWLEEQHRFGICIRLIRESALLAEPELVADFGIYGNRAIGRQLSDIGGRTVRFQLSFEFDDIRQAEDIWERLQVFSTSYSELLDQQH